jgi:hypothetical protein
MTKKKPIKLWFTDFWRPSTEENIRKLRLYLLLSKRWEIILTPHQPEFLIYSCSGFEHLKYNCIRIFYTGENVRPCFDRCDYAFSFDYPITERNYRLPLYRLDKTHDQLFHTREPDRIVSEKRKFCCFLSSNPKAQERIAFFDLLSQYKPVDSGGADKNNIGYRVNDKMTWLKNYKFSIAFENSQYPGYTTEKLLHALVANTIPIYWGNPAVANDFNCKAFINCHDYGSFEDVIEVVKKIDQDDVVYREYLSQPYFLDGIENEFCREENILAKFNHIFTERTEYIPREIKNRQKIIFLGLRIKYFLKRARKKLSSLMHG